MSIRMSADELFHFTKFEHLIGIIENGFYPRYNLEHTLLSDLYPQRPGVILPIPMVCFCDIPLEMVHDHIEKYGKCAIGLDKVWGEKYGLNPVLYINRNSIVGDAISTLGNSFAEYTANHLNHGSDMKLVLINTSLAIGIQYVSLFVKQYERTEDTPIYINGDLFTLKKGRFYDEREWRFVPSQQGDNELWLINANTLNDKDKLDAAHTKLEKHALKFKIEDIKYIICETLEEKEKITKVLCERFNIDSTTVTATINIKLINELQNENHN